MNNFKKIIQKKIEEEIEYLTKHQQADGSFLSVYSADSQKFDLKQKKQITLCSAQILCCLNHLKNNSAIKEIKDKLAQFLLSQKDETWSFNQWPRKTTESEIYADSLDATFYALIALKEYDPAIIDGKALAKILTLLTSVEQQEGGPYYSWKKIKPENAEIDLATNILVANFLKLLKVDLPNLNKLITKAIKTQDFASFFYCSQYPVLFFLSQFYQNKDDLVLKEKLTASLQITDNTLNPLNNILKSCALINLQLPAKENRAEIEKIINYKSAEVHQPYVFCLIPNKYKVLYVACPALNSAMYLSCLNHILNEINLTSFADKNKETDKVKEKNYDQIKNLAQKNFSSLGADLQTKTLKVFEKIIKSDQKDQQILLLPYFFKTSLGKLGEKISDDLIVQLGLANLYLWMAYTVYDDFLDEEGKPETLSTANICLREFTSIFNNLFPAGHQFHSFFRDLMNTLDNANTWETSYCRTKVGDGQMCIPENIPDFQNFDKLAERSIAHALGPLTILFSLGYTADSPEVKNLLLFFKHYLIGRQINDDAHDWEEDLSRGHLDSINTIVLKKWKNSLLAPPSTISQTKIIADLQKIFWRETLSDACQEMTKQVNLSKKHLRSVPIINNYSILEKLLLPIKRTVQKTLAERRDVMGFIEGYGDGLRGF